MTDEELMELRGLSGSQRAEGYLAARAKQETTTPATPASPTRWHLVDRDLTPEQYDQIPAALPGDTRTPDVWVKFHEFRSREPVITRGYFDHDGANWTARTNPIDHSDCRRVIPIAWMEIAAGSGSSI